MLSRLPKNHFGAILADPPWRFETWSEKGKDRSPDYPVMRERELKQLPVADLAKNNSVLFLWVTWPSIQSGFALIEAWGFTYKTCAFCWAKARDGRPTMGLGYWTRANSEVCLLGTRGKPKRLDAGVRQLIVAPPREHSRKPDGIHERIERLVAGPYLELFARQRRKGWRSWGNEVGKFGK